MQFCGEKKKIINYEDREAQSVEQLTANLAARVRSPLGGEEPSVLMSAFLQV